MLFAAGAFALNGDNVSAKVAAAFKNDFSHASKVKWEKKSDFYFVSFELNNTHVDAAYNEAGERVGTSRKIKWEQLPLALSLEISKNYDDFSTPEQVTELIFEGQTTYYLSVENDRQIVNLKCYSNGDMEVESKTKKEPVKS